MVLLAAAGMALQMWAQGNAAEACLRTRTSFDLLVHASYAETAPLFGPEGERAWTGKHWDPQFIFPQPAKDVEGAVFTVRHGAMSAVWVNTLFDVEGRHFQYVYVIPEVMVTVIGPWTSVGDRGPGAPVKAAEHPHRGRKVYGRVRSSMSRSASGL